MAKEKYEPGFRGQLLGASTRHKSLAYGYSLAMTGSFGVPAELTHHVAFPDVIAFTMGAAFTFTIANAVVTRGFRYRVAQEPPVVIAFGTSFGFLSIAASLGVAASWGWLLPDWVGWALAGFFGSAIYLAGTALELTFAHGVRALVGRELEER